ncbi:MAG: FAD-binding oxidoreductase [Pseudomonadota bacterium]|nr:FAD-binding oxidoreductase [Pseudomonadota bacterium]
MQALIASLQEACSSPLLTGTDITEKHQHDWSAETPGIPVAVVRPASTDEVAAVMRVCAAAGQPVVVQGGLSGLCGGGNPRANEVALSLERLQGIEEIDAASMTMTVKAGTPLQAIQQAADAAGFVFPLDLGARGSCNIGGNISTNAGGNQVLRFGMTRNLVLGLEAVLADGTVISSMNKMLKNNAAYDLKHLFIGTEGTLGIVTRAVLRLFPKSASRCSALVAVNDFPAVIALLQRLSRDCGAGLSAFEVMWASYYDFIIDNCKGITSPFDARHPIYVLTELEGSDAAKDQALFESTLGDAMEQGLIVDAAIASSQREREGFWKIRDGVGEIGAFIKNTANFDVSVPISSMQAFLDAVDTELKAALPECKMLVFGHIADSNLHFMCYTGRKEDVKTIYGVVYRTVGQYEGSVSAEHGIGVQKLSYLQYSRSPEEIALMRTLKQALDPNGILNPGRVIPEAAAPENASHFASNNGNF